MRFTKKVGAVSAGMLLLLVAPGSTHGQAIGPLPMQTNNLIESGTNAFWIQLCITDNCASLVLYVPPTATNNVLNLFFISDLESTSGWTRLMRLLPGETNAIVSNLPAAQGFFTLKSPIRPGFAQQTLDRNDDGSTTSVPLPFTINFLGNSESALYVNNNGNVTFEQALSVYTPEPLVQAKAKIIAPFWADVDTRNTASAVVQYGTNTVHGHTAFGANWVNVGYYAMHADKLLSCQLVFIDRSDIAVGDFDMEFNYDRVEWEAGDVSGGSGGYWQGMSGGPARAGFSDGSADYELPGSGVGGGLLDSNFVTGLVNSSQNSSLPGRYAYFFRSGQPLPNP